MSNIEKIRELDTEEFIKKMEEIFRSPLYGYIDIAAYLNGAESTADYLKHMGTAVVRSTSMTGEKCYVLGKTSIFGVPYYIITDGTDISKVPAGTVSFGAE